MTLPVAGSCWHDGKGVHVRIAVANAGAVRFRRPSALSDSVWATVDFLDCWEKCTEHP